MAQSVGEVEGFVTPKAADDCWQLSQRRRRRRQTSQILRKSLGKNVKWIEADSFEAVFWLNMHPESGLAFLASFSFLDGWQLGWMSYPQLTKQYWA